MGEGLTFDTVFTGKLLIELDSVDSSNNYARELLTKGNVFDGSIVLANHQEKGRGQRESAWISEPGKNLTFSIIYFPVFLNPNQAFCLSKAISLGIINYLKSLNIDAKIKWPNDIIFNGKKIAGILIENQIQNKKIHSSIIGIGLNVNQEYFDGISATSIQNIKGFSIDLKDSLKLLISQIEYFYLKIRENPQFVNLPYLENLLYLNEEKTYLFKGEVLRATINGVSENGELILKSNQKNLQAGFKEIHFVELDGQ